MSMAFPSSVMAAPCHLPPGEGFLFLTPGAGAGADMIRPESCPKNGIPQSASLTASPIPFVPSGHFPLIRGIGPHGGSQGAGDSGRMGTSAPTECDEPCP